MTAWLALNGINVGVIASVGGSPKGDRRDVGGQLQAVDGTTQITRSGRKHDQGFESVPLSGSDALAWESLIIGEGEVWNFDVNLYGSKGRGPSAVTAAARNTSPSVKFGAGKLRVTGTTGTITFAGAALNSSGADNGSTVMVWRLEISGWNHYTVTSDGACWLNGGRADGTDHSWLTFGSAGTGDVTIAATSSTTFDYDDLVVLPYRVLDTWPPIWGVATAAFSPLPKLYATGNLVREASSRLVEGTCSDSAILVALLGTTLQHDARKLAIELKEV